MEARLRADRIAKGARSSAGPFLRGRVAGSMSTRRTARGTVASTSTSSSSMPTRAGIRRRALRRSRFSTHWKRSSNRLQRRIEARWARHKAMAARTQEWIRRSATKPGKSWPTSLRSARSHRRSRRFRLPSDLPAENFTGAVAKHGIIVGNGYGKLKSSTFRIGHMGDHTVETLERCLAACSSVLRT